VLEAIIEQHSFTQYGLWKTTGVAFGTAHNVVKFLEQKKVVAKSGKKYVITSWPGLFALFSAFRSFPKPLASLQLAMSVKGAERYLADKKFIFCLTSAWRHYDDYLHDPQLHVYAPGRTEAEQAMKELSRLAKGNTIVNIYPQDLEVRPIRKKILFTSLPRTLLDLSSSQYAYGTENWIRKQATKWQQK